MLPGITSALLRPSGPAAPDPLLIDDYTVGLWHFDSVAEHVAYWPNYVLPGSYASVNATANAALAGAGSSAIFQGIAWFDGGAGYATVPNHNNWEFGAGDFTIDWWEYRTSSASGKAVMARDGTTLYAPFLIGYSNNSVLNVYMSSDGATWDIASQKSLGAITLNVWNHFAVVRKGTTFYLFKNGVLTDTWTSSLTIRANANPLSFGRTQGSGYYAGYIEELRISKGIARWTSNFTPLSAPYKYPFIGGNDINTILLLHCDNPHGATTTYDNSPSARGAFTAVQPANTFIHVAANKFGSGGIYSNGSGYWSGPARSADFDFGSGNFTIDWWAAIGAFSNATGNHLTPWGLLVDATSAIRFTYLADGHVQFVVLINNAVTFSMTTPTVFAVAGEGWVHWAVVRNGNIWRIYKNGSMIMETNQAYTIPANINGLYPIPYVGCGESGNYIMNGSVDELRISKGVARWTSNFIPPKYPYDASTVATKFSVTISPASANINTARTMTVQALDIVGRATTNYSGTVHFTSNEGGATLPADAVLTNGAGTFSVTFKTTGTKYVVATDAVTPSITGQSANVTSTNYTNGSATITTVGSSQWTVPAGFNPAHNTIECYGGGGGGSGGFGTNSYGGGGAGGGAWSRIDNVGMVEGQTWNCYVGGGGAPDPGNHQNGDVDYRGGTGGDTWFGDPSWVTAKGGEGGHSFLSDKGGGGGGNVVITAVGGQAAAGVGTYRYNGGNSGTWTMNYYGQGTGGGGAAGPSGNGGYGGDAPGSGAGGGGAGGYAGRGGNGGIYNNRGVENGSAYGGGGGGGADWQGVQFTGGYGVQGLIVITWYAT